MTQRMAWRDGALVFLLALSVRLIFALPLSQPGYMDAYYYTVGGQQLARGQGFTEPFIWNYLDHPTNLPRPSHQYWMPLPSILAAAGMLIGGVNFRAAQAPFALLSALLPVIAYAIAWQAARNRRHAWATALLTIFSGFFTAFWSLPETFAPFAVFGALAIWASAHSGRWAIVAGFGAGLGHLTRADGVLLLLPVLILPLFTADSWGKRARAWLWAIAGYAAVTSPWLIHNWLTTGRPLSMAGTQTIFLTHYDDLFSLDKPLNLATYLAWGASNILRSKLDALWSNLATLIAVVGMVFLAPFAALGAWLRRRDAFFQSALIYGAALYLVMSLVFTLPGVRGGLFHSGAALLPFVFAAAMIGLDATIAWIAARRKTWNAIMAQRVFTAGLVALAVAMSAMIFQSRSRGWNQADAVYAEIGARLAGQPRPVVLVNNAPGYVYHTGHKAISIPNGDVETLFAAAQRFGAQWVVLDANNLSLADLYARPQSEPRLILIETLKNPDGQPVYLFRVR